MPFGSPVLPLLNRIAAGWLLLTRAVAPQAASSQRIGHSRARIAAPRRSPRPTPPSRSSRNSDWIPAGSSTFNFSRKAREVTTLCSPACRIAEASAAGPTV